MNVTRALRADAAPAAAPLAPEPSAAPDGFERVMAEAHAAVTPRAAAATSGLPAPNAEVEAEGTNPLEPMALPDEAVPLLVAPLLVVPVPRPPDIAGQQHTPLVADAEAPCTAPAAARPAAAPPLPQAGAASLPAQDGTLAPLPDASPTAVAGGAPASTPGVPVPEASAPEGEVASLEMARGVPDPASARGGPARAEYGAAGETTTRLPEAPPSLAATHAAAPAATHAAAPAESAEAVVAGLVGEAALADSGGVGAHRATAPPRTDVPVGAQPSSPTDTLSTEAPPVPDEPGASPENPRTRGVDTSGAAHTDSIPASVLPPEPANAPAASSLRPETAVLRNTAVPPEASVLMDEAEISETSQRADDGSPTALTTPQAVLEVPSEEGEPSDRRLRRRDSHRATSRVELEAKEGASPGSAVGDPSLLEPPTEGHEGPGVGDGKTVRPEAREAERSAPAESVDAPTTEGLTAPEDVLPAPPDVPALADGDDAVVAAVRPARDEAAAPPSPPDARVARAENPLLARWQADIRALASELRNEAGGWQRLRIQLDDEGGTVTLRARREHDRVALNVAFSDPALRQTAQASAERLQAALETQLGHSIDFSFDGDSGSRQQPSGERPGASRPALSNPAAVPSRSAASAPPTGPREWIG